MVLENSLYKCLGLVEYIVDNAGSLVLDIPTISICCLYWRPNMCTPSTSIWCLGASGPHVHQIWLRWTFSYGILRDYCRGRGRFAAQQVEDTPGVMEGVHQSIINVCNGVGGRHVEAEVKNRLVNRKQKCLWEMIKFPFWFYFIIT